MDGDVWGAEALRRHPDGRGIARKRRPRTSTLHLLDDAAPIVSHEVDDAF